MINYISSPIRQRKIGELWSTNQKVIDAHVDPPKWTFFGILNFGRYGVLDPEIFNTADIHQGLLTHTINRVGDPQKILRAKI